MGNIRGQAVAENGFSGDPPYAPKNKYILTIFSQFCKPLQTGAYRVHFDAK